MSRPKVFIYRPVDRSEASHRLLESAGCDVLVGKADADTAALLELAAGSAALMGATFQAGVIDREFLAALPALRIVSKYTIGFDDVDLAAATELGVLVTHCPTEANWGGVAEGAVAMMLALLKRIRERDRQVRAGGWRDPGLRGVHVGARADGYAGIAIGIIGLGRAGGRLAELLAPWRARVMAYDPYVEAARFERHGVERIEDLARLLKASDVVSLHCNLTDETRSLIGARELASMKATAVLINTSRGAVVDTDDLCSALEAGRLAGAALDVFAEEPLPADARLRSLGDAVLLSPHMVAANSASPLEPAVPWATQATLDALRGVVPERICNEAAIDKWRQRFGGRPCV